MKKYFLILVALLPSPVLATDYYADNLVACTANYNPSTRACDGNSGNSYTTFAAAVAPLQPGDTLYIRAFSGGAGVWNDRINLQDAGKTGTAGNYISFIGYPGDTVTIRYTDTGSYGAIKARGNRGYFLFQNLIIDGVNYAVGTVWAIRDGGHHFILRNVEIKNTKTSALYIGGDDIEISGSYFHDTVSATCDSGSRYYGIYLHDGSRVTITGSVMEQNPGGGVQVYPGPFTDIVVAGNVMRNNGSCPGTDHGGMVLGSDSTGTGGGPITNVSVYDNVIHTNGQAGYGGAGTGGNTGGTGHGIRVFYARPTGSLSNVKINNNTIYNNFGGASKPAYGIALQGGANNVEVKNNIVLNNEDGQINDAGTGNTITHNACLSGDACGTTGKVSVAGLSAVTISTSDFRLKQGTNPARNAGTAVSTRPAPVGVTDIGAYEQGLLASAVVVGTVIEATANIMTAPLVPSAGISGLSITCITCTGTPVATAILKPSSTGVMQISISGLTSSGTCSLNLGSTNATDSGTIGNSSLGSAQALNSVTGLTVSGTCANATGGGGGGTGLYSRLLLEEGSGTVANDDSGLAHHGTVSAGVGWVTGGITIPTDATFRHIDTGYGSGVNPTTQSFTQCAYVVLDLAQVPSVVSGSLIGTNQRAYYGVQTVGGQAQWGIGVQGSGFSTGSEFVATANPTLVCILFDAATDTATLRVDNVNGAITGKSVKTYTSYTLASSLRVGNDGTFTTNNGGFTVYGIWTWDTLASESDLDALYDLLSPSGTSLACYTQDTHKWEGVFTDGSSPIPFGAVGQPIQVVDGGGVALNIQITCTGVAGASVAFRFFYTSDDVTYHEIPAILGAGGIAMWGADSQSGLNSGATTGRINGSLTPTPGITLLTASVSPTVALAQDSAYEIRLLLRLAPGLVGQHRSILVKQDNGLPLANAPTIGVARIDIVNPLGGGLW